MNGHAAGIVGRLILICLALVSWPLSAAESAKPNFLIIIADDLGFSDLGSYGGEIATPNLDRLAQQGLRFTQFYNTARCWPTRTSLMTGYYAQQIRRDTLPGGADFGGQGVRPRWAPLLPEILKPLGYRSYHSGKWHIDGAPTANGFDRSFDKEDFAGHFSVEGYTEDGRRRTPIKADSGFYATTAIADRAIEHLQEHAAQHAGRPFFEYIAFTAPHFPLHALPEDIARYRDRYKKGWDLIRKERWQRVQKMGLVEAALQDMERDVGYRAPARKRIAHALGALRSARRPRRIEQSRAKVSRKSSRHGEDLDERAGAYERVGREG